MDVVFYLATAAGVGIWLWMNILVAIAVRHDVTLNSFQIKAQTIVISLLPILGAGFLHLVWQQYHSLGGSDEQIHVWVRVDCLRLF